MLPPPTSAQLVPFFCCWQSWLWRARAASGAGPRARWWVASLSSLIWCLYGGSGCGSGFRFGKTGMNYESRHHNYQYYFLSTYYSIINHISIFSPIKWTKKKSILSVFFQKKKKKEKEKRVVA